MSESSRSALPAPLQHPLGDGHHTDVPLTAEDEAQGSHFAYSMGTLYADIAENVVMDAAAREAAYGHFFYRVSTPQNEWARVVRALRVHGLKIVTAQGIEAGTGETREAGLDAKHESPVGNADAP